MRHDANTPRVALIDSAIARSERPPGIELSTVLSSSAARLGGKGGIGEYIPKPKGMRWRTYDRQIARGEVVEQRTTMHAWLLIKSLNARLKR